MSDSILTALGEIEELGGNRAPRIILPESYYIMKLEVQDYIVTDLSDQRNIDPPLLDEHGQPLTDPDTGEVLEMPAGGSPTLQLQASVADGPFAELGAQFNYRQPLTPGKGGFIGYVNSAVKAVTGEMPDRAALEAFNFTFENGADNKLVQQLFRTQFYLLKPQDRQKFMAIWARTAGWNGQTVVCKVEHEYATKTNDIGEEYEVTYHRVNGYFPLSHAKKGRAWVAKTCYPMQQQAVDALGESTEG